MGYIEAGFAKRAEGFKVAGVRWISVATVVLVALIALIDMVLCRGFSLWVLYLLPVGLSAWLLGLRFSGWVIALSMLLMAFDGLMLGNPFVSQGMYFYALACRVLACLVVAVLCARMRRVEELEQQVTAYEELCDSLHVSPSATRLRREE